MNTQTINRDVAGAISREYGAWPCDLNHELGRYTWDNITPDGEYHRIEATRYSVQIDSPRLDDGEAVYIQLFDELPGLPVWFKVAAGVPHKGELRTYHCTVNDLIGLFEHLGFPAGDDL